MGRSPKVIDVQAKMDFYTALREVVNGKKVTRISWNNPDAFLYIGNDFLKTSVNDKGIPGDFTLVVSMGDLTALDWIIKE